jgi:hypothetical protein
MSFENTDGESTICLSKKLPRKDVLTLFDEIAFSELFEETRVDIEIKQNILEYQGWYAPKYTQVIKNATAYFYDKDPGKENLIELSDGKELIYHECESMDEKFGVNVEVWADGDTDVFLQIYIDGAAIGEMHPYV